MSNKRDSIKVMADLLRQGATLTELSCPACSSPLFKLKRGDLWCANCEKQVVKMKKIESSSNVLSPIALNSVESTILSKIQEIESKIKSETNIDNLNKLGAILSTLLENLEKVRKIKKK